MKWLLAIAAAAAIMLVRMPAEAGGAHREVVRSMGTAFCSEDARLVPVRHHGYMAESVSGWVYTCKNFDEPGKFAP